MKFRISQLLPLAVFGVLLSGCAGYQLGDVKPSVYSGIEKIHVPPFKNLTLEPRLSSLVTNAVLVELQADGTYQVSTKSNADAVLVGTIRHIEKRQLRAVRTDTLRSRELSLLVHVEFHLEDPSTGARITGRAPQDQNARLDGKKGTADEVIGARQGLVIGDTIQFVDASFQVGERNALAMVAEDVADKLVSQLVNGW